MPRKPRVRKHRGVFEKDKGSNIWWVRFVDTDGKRKSRCIGTFSDAVNFYEEQKVRIRKRIVAPVPSHKGIRYKQLVEAAIKQSNPKRGDHRNFVQRLTATAEKFGHRMAESITPSEIDEWFLDMEEELEWLGGTVNRYKAVMSKAFKLAIADGKVTRNPARLVPQRRESNGRIRFLTNEEEMRLRKALRARPNCVPQLDVALHTGMRKTEQFTATWEQVDVTNKYIHLNETKNGSNRYVALNSQAIRVLKALEQQHDQLGLPADSPLFLSRHNIPMANPREWFANACEEAKIKGVTWHILRHTFASRLVMAGVDLPTVKELMGHKTIQMTMRYAHLAPAHKLNALEKLVARQRPARGDGREQTAQAQHEE